MNSFSIFLLLSLFSLISCSYSFNDCPTFLKIRGVRVLNPLQQNQTMIFKATKVQNNVAEMYVIDDFSSSHHPFFFMIGQLTPPLKQDLRLLHWELSETVVSRPVSSSMWPLHPPNLVAVTINISCSHTPPCFVRANTQGVCAKSSSTAQHSLYPICFLG